ncbi:MAG: PqqD family protein [Sphingobacterium sp.]
MKLREDLTLRKVGNEYFIVEPDQGMVDLSKVFTLNETAAFLWNALQGRDFDIQSAADILIAEYQIDQQTAINDTQKILDMFKSQSLTLD